MNCPQKSVLSAYLDGETDWFENSIVELHLNVCSACRKSLRVSAKLKELVHAIEPPDRPSSLTRDILEMTKASMSQENAGARYNSALTGLIAAASGIVLLFLLKIARPSAQPARPEISLNALIAAHNRSVESSPFAPTEAVLSSAFEMEREAPDQGHDDPIQEVF